MRLLAMPLLLLVPMLGSAQESTVDAEAVRLDAVIVTVPRVRAPLSDVPASVDVIVQADIRAAQPRNSLAESLARVPGVFARDRQNLAQDLQLSIRGVGARATFGVRGLRIYTDGIPASMPDGQGQVSHIALDAAQRIEVLRGPFSALYGNAAGGVIQVFSAPPPGHVEAEAGLFAGSDGMQHQALAVRWPQRFGGMSLDAAGLHSDGYRDHSAAVRDMLQWQLNAVGARTRLTAIAHVLRLEADDPQGLTRSEADADPRAASPGALAFDTRKTVQQQQLGALLEHDLGERAGLRLLVYAGHRDTAQMLSVPVAAQRSPLSSGGAIDLERQYHGFDLRWRFDHSLGGWPLATSVGLTQESMHEHRRGYENFIGDRLGLRGALRRDQVDSVVETALYAQGDWDIAPRWRVTGGLRRSGVNVRSRDRYVTPGNPDDSGRVRFGDTAPVFGVLFRLAPGTVLYANAGRGFETPTLSELAYRRDGASGLNLQLRPARSRGAEAGARVRHGRGKLAAAVFDMRTTDEIVAVTNAGGRASFANAAGARRRGFELSGDMALGGHWDAALAYTWLDARYRGDFLTCAAVPCAQPDLRIAGGTRIPGLAGQVGWARLRWSRNGWDAALEANAQSDVRADDRGIDGSAGHATFDASLQRIARLGQAELTGFVRVNNVTDRRYIGSVIVNQSNGRFFEPAPGRNWSVGLNLRLGQRDN